MKSFIGSFNTFNNNKNALSPKKLSPTKLNKAAISLLEDSGDIVLISGHNESLHYFKLNKYNMETTRLNTVRARPSKTQLTKFSVSKRTVLYSRHKGGVYRYRPNLTSRKELLWCYRKTK
jgi:hypothetical protein